MKKSTSKKKGRSRKKPPRPGSSKQSPPPFESVAQREMETVIEVISGGRTAERAVEVGLSALIWADHALARFDGENDLPRPISCIEGCDHCCFSQVELTPPEALVIGQAVERRFPPEEKDRLLERVGRALAAKAGKSKKDIAASRREFPCPLLQGGKCLVYPVRPLVCRGMHSLEAAKCESSLLAGDLTTGAYYSQRHELVRAIARGLAAGCRTVGCQAGYLDLSQALQDYFRKPEPAVRWVKGEAVFNL
jgi:Fe-S-cluster containining protein